MIEINTDFENIKAIINQFNNGKLIDVNDCKARMNELLEKIKKFGHDSDLEVLQKEQKDLEDYLYDFKVTLKKYESKKSSTPIKSKIIRKSSENINKIDTDYSEVKDFESLIVKTGHTQHWKEEDHNYFIQIRNKFRSIPAMVTEIQKKYPDLSTDKIVNHEAWYKVYINLREKQRNSVKLWRAKKESEKKEKIESIKNNELKNISPQYESKSGNEFSDNESESPKILILKKDNVIDNQKELIKQWKIEKARAKIESEIELKKRLENERILREKQFLTRIMKSKEALLKYQQDKILKVQSLRHENKQNDKIVKSSTIIKSFRQKDNAFINKRKHLLELKNQNSMKYNYKTNNDNKSTSFKSNPSKSTLMKSTILWDEKCRKEETLENQKPLLYIKDIPKLLRHNWRNQESFT
ncbi:coiled-coil domain-containing protein 112-like isoform X1 [Cotesia glomerata]|uniref:Uncharacterized protein n=1 Tax=Cotesia glomerata TaxID=32391 RepID=A0AAV7HKW6_COTGL|nr:coiled-coil domain-containing protein 112-like isoform X1 [Cotesia glomerata]KAH0540495.1 hypothetical protein KQX54_017761 [Cotesia glomerata]